MGREFDKRAFLTGEMAANRFDLDGLPPNRRAWLAQTGRQQSNQALSRMAPERRLPVLMAFCVEALERTTDDAIEIYDRALGAADGRRSASARSSSVAPAATHRQRSEGSSTSQASCFRRTTTAAMFCG